jgi:hypothetical protein
MIATAAIRIPSLSKTVSGLVNLLFSLWIVTMARIMLPKGAKTKRVMAVNKVNSSPVPKVIRRRKNDIPGRIKDNRAEREY